MNPELGVVLLSVLAAILVTGPIWSLILSADPPSPVLGCGSTLDLTINYLSHYLLAASVLSPLLGMALGKPLLILLLPVLHFFAAIVILPGAFVITYVGRRRLKRKWTRTRAWSAAVLSVMGMWFLSCVLVWGCDRPPELLVRLLGEGLAAVALVISVAVTASSASLTLAWMIPSVRSARDE